MMESNNFNLLENELDKSIYRIIDFDRLVQILKLGRNNFVRTFLWEDPFENLFTNVIFESKRKFRISNLSKYIFAQCWTFSEENDLLWRTYSPNKEGVRIKSSPRKLIESLEISSKIQLISKKPKILYVDNINNESIIENINCFCGKVKYLTKEDIVVFFKTNCNIFNLDLYLETLLIKREAFRNEEEFRIGVYHFNELDEIMLELSDNIFQYDFEFNTVFEEVLFDPRISEEKFYGLKEVLRKYKFNNPIYKSRIYDKPDINDFSF